MSERPARQNAGKHNASKAEREATYQRIWEERAKQVGNRAKTVKEIALAIPGVTISQVEYAIFERWNSPFFKQRDHAGRGSHMKAAGIKMPTKPAPKPKQFAAPKPVHVDAAPKPRLNTLPVWLWTRCQHQVDDVYGQCTDKAHPPHRLCIRHRR